MVTLLQQAILEIIKEKFQFIYHTTITDIKGIITVNFKDHRMTIIPQEATCQIRLDLYSTELRCSIQGAQYIHQEAQETKKYTTVSLHNIKEAIDCIHFIVKNNLTIGVVGTPKRISPLSYY